MAVPSGIEDAKSWSELVVAVGAALMAIGYGVKRIYNMAKNVDTLLTTVNENNEVGKKVLLELNSVKSEQERIRDHVQKLQSWQDREEGKQEAEAH